MSIRECAVCDRNRGEILKYHKWMGFYSDFDVTKKRSFRMFDLISVINFQDATGTVQLVGPSKG